MQSGISASEELVSQFRTLLSKDNAFALVTVIESERLVPSALIEAPSSNNSFEANLPLLEPHLTPKQPVFLLVRRHTTSPHLIAITYVPDAAPVRQKTLFASSRQTLLRDLGLEHFRDNIFATTPQELTADGFSKQDAHAALEAPLTEEERVLGDVKRAEKEQGWSGTGAREFHLSKTMSMKVDDAAIAALKEVTNGRNMVMLKINPEVETIELVPDTSSPQSFSDVVARISTTEPRFTFFRYEHEFAGARHSSVLFVYTNPATAGSKAIKNRMLYPLMKRAVLQVAKDESGLEPDKKFEVEEPTEITEDMVLAELHPRTEAKQTFSRPKRPGR